LCSKDQNFSEWAGAKVVVSEIDSIAIGSASGRAASGFIDVNIGFGFNNEPGHFLVISNRNEVLFHKVLGQLKRGLLEESSVQFRTSQILNMKNAIPDFDRSLRVYNSHIWIQ